MSNKKIKTLKEFKELLDGKIIDEKQEDIKTQEIWGLEVIPFLSLSTMDEIIDAMLEVHTLSEREGRLMAGVLNGCCDILDQYDDKNEKIDVNYTEIVYSGFWDTLMQECPYLKECVKQIRNEIERRESFQYVLNHTLEKFSDAFTNLDVEKIMENMQNIENIPEVDIKGN